VILLFDHLPTEPPPPDDDPVPTTPPPRGDHLPTEPPMPYHSVELNMFYPKPVQKLENPFSLSILISNQIQMIFKIKLNY